MAKKIQNVPLYILFGIIIFLMFISIVFAQSDDYSPPTFAGGIGVIITIIMVYQINKADRIATEETGKKPAKVYRFTNPNTVR